MRKTLPCLLRLIGTAKRKEHSAKSEDCDFFLHVFILTIAYA